MFSKGIVEKPIVIDYFALSGENADVDGMADCYRNYLTKTKKLDKTLKTKKLPPLNI